MWSAGEVVRFGDGERHGIHSYYDVCPESPDGTRVLMSVFDGPEVPGPAHVVVIDDEGRCRRVPGPSAHVLGHSGRFALWVDDRRIAYRNGGDEAYCGWTLLDLRSGRGRELPGGLRQWHLGTRRGLVQLPGPFANPHRLRQGFAVVDDRGAVLREYTVRDCVAAAPAGVSLPEEEQLAVMNLKWSPGGERFSVVFGNMLYRKRVDAAAPLHKSLLVFDSLDGEARWLGTFTHHPTWLPDGSALTVFNRRAGTQDLVAYSVHEPGRRTVLLRDVPGLHGTMLPDGRRFVVDVPEKDGTACSLLLIDVRTGAREPLARFMHDRWRHEDGFHPHPVLSADGRSVYFNALDGGACRLCRLALP